MAMSGNRAPALTMYGQGVRAGLGTDGPMSGNTLDIVGQLGVTKVQIRQQGSQRRAGHGCRGNGTHGGITSFDAQRLGGEAGPLSGRRVSLRRLG
jgi:hypothetical protein